MNVVYIAAPFGAPTHEERLANVERAEQLATIARLEGLAPICIHRGVLSGIYGNEDSEYERAAGVEMAASIAAKADAIWLLLREDGTLSSGCAAELVAYLCNRRRGDCTEVRIFTQEQIVQAQVSAEIVRAVHDAG